MSSDISFRIKEAYKKITKQAAIGVVKLFHASVNIDEKPPEKIRSIVILAQERFGDLIVMTPLLKLLRQNYPDTELVVLGVTDIIYFLKNDPHPNVLINIKRCDKSIRKKLLARQYDLLYNTKDHPSFTFQKLTIQIRAKHKVGIFHRKQSGIFNHMIELPDALPTVEKNAALLAYLGIRISKDDLRPYLPQDETAPEILDFVKNTPKKELIGINLSASNRTKEWGMERWREFLARTEEPMIILSSPEHVENKKQLESEFKHVVACPATPTIHDVGVLVEHIKLLVTPDTSLVHVAACFNTPVVALYRNERDMKKFPPLSEVNRVHITPTAVIDDIPVKDVLESFQAVLAEIRPD